LYKQSDMKLVRTNNTQTEHTKTQNKYTDVNTAVSKYMDREQHDNGVVQYKAQQK
jgi:hypothetical protein